MPEPVVDVLEGVHVEDEERERLAATLRAAMFRVEAPIEMSPVEEAREWIGVGELAQLLVGTHLREAGGDVRGQDLERLQVLDVERLPVGALGDAEDALGVVVDEDRNGHERVRVIFAAARRAGVVPPAYEDRALRRGDAAGDAFTFADPGVLEHVVRDPVGHRDDEMRIGAFAQEQARAFAANERGRHLEDGLQKLLSVPLRDQQAHA